MSATSLPIAFNACCEHSCHNMHLTAELVLHRDARTWTRLRRSSKILVLADGPETRLEPVEDLQGALVIGRYCFGWNSIKNSAEILVGLWDAPLFLQ
jgi:hypothetical protein